MNIIDQLYAVLSSSSATNPFAKRDLPNTHVHPDMAQFSKVRVQPRDKTPSNRNRSSE